MQCGPSHSTDACIKCTEENCCNENMRCNSDARCEAYYGQCLPDCTKSGSDANTCVVQCDAQPNTAGHAVYAPLAACQNQHCLGDCGSADDCETCLQAQCRDVAFACESDARCAVLRACLILCN